MELFGIELDTLRGLVLVLLMLAFGGIWAWAWNGARQDAFRAAAQLPLEEDDGRIPGCDRAPAEKE